MERGARRGNGAGGPHPAAKKTAQTAAPLLRDGPPPQAREVGVDNSARQAACRVSDVPLGEACLAPAKHRCEQERKARRDAAADARWPARRTAGAGANLPRAAGEVRRRKARPFPPSFRRRGGGLAASRAKSTVPLPEARKRDGVDDFGRSISVDRPARLSTGAASRAFRPRPRASAPAWPARWRRAAAGRRRPPARRAGNWGPSAACPRRGAWRRCRGGRRR